MKNLCRVSVIYAGYEDKCTAADGKNNVCTHTTYTVPPLYLFFYFIFDDKQQADYTHLVSFFTRVFSPRVPM